MAAGRGGGGRGRGGGRGAGAAAAGGAATAAAGSATSKKRSPAAGDDDDGFDAAEIEDDEDGDDLFDPWNIDEPDSRFEDEEADDDADAAKAFDVDSLVNGDRGIAGAAGVEEEDDDTVRSFDDLDDDDDDDDDVEELDEDDDDEDDDDDVAPRGGRWSKRALALDDDDDDDDDDGIGEHDDDDVDTPIRQRKRPTSPDVSALGGSTVEEEEPLADGVDDLDADLGLLAVAGADVLVGADENMDDPVVFDPSQPDMPSQRGAGEAVDGDLPEVAEEEEEEEDLEDEALGSIDLTQLLRSRPWTNEELAPPAGGASADLASLFDKAHQDDAPPAAVTGGDSAAADKLAATATTRFADVPDSPEASAAARSAEQTAFDADEDYEADGPMGLDYYTNDGEEYEGDTDEFGVTQDTSFGRVWALNDDNYVTITEPGEGFVFGDADVAATDEEDNGGGSNALHKHDATRRATPAWGASAASAWPAAMGGGVAMDAGSKEWAARAAYDQSTSASPVEMYRWSRKHSAPPAGMEELFPYEAAELPKLARLTLEIQDMPMEDSPLGEATARMADAEVADDESEYLSYYQELYKYEGDEGDDIAGAGGAAAALGNVREVPAAAYSANGAVDAGVIGDAIALDADEEEARLAALEAATQQRLASGGATPAPTSNKRAARPGASAADYHALSRTMSFPCECRFKAVGDGEDFVRSVLADIESVTGVPVPAEAVVEEPSDRYRRLNIGVTVTSAVQIGAVFEAIRANRLVRFCFSS